MARLSVPEFPQTRRQRFEQPHRLSGVPSGELEKAEQRLHLELPDLEVPARRHGVGGVCGCALVSFVGSDLRSDPCAEARAVPEVLSAQLGDLVGELGDARPVSRAQLEPRAVEAHSLDHLFVPAIRCAPQRVRERLARLVDAVEVHEPERLHDARRCRARRRVNRLLERERIGQRLL